MAALIGVSEQAVLASDRDATVRALSGVVGEGEPALGVFGEDNRIGSAADHGDSSVPSLVAAAAQRTSSMSLQASIYRTGCPS